MSATRNARDLLIQAAPSRYSNPPNAAIILTASSPIFKIPAGGGADPSPITFTVSLIELAGTVTFVPTGCTLTVVGNVATLTYANMPGATASVSATLTENGQAYASNLCSVSKVLDGIDGTTGLNNARVFAYQRAATAPTLSPGDVTVTFASNSITAPAALLNGWVRDIPTANGNPLYVVAISGAGTGSSVNLLSASWSGAAVMATDGPGGTGTDGTNGLNAATIMIFQRSASATGLSKPSASTTYTFATGVLTGLNNGWTQGVPAADPAKPFLQTSLATAISASATDTVAASEWSTVQVLARDGTNGIDGTSITGARGAGHFYQIGNPWSDALANAATPGENMVDDVVTVSAADGTYSLTKKWTGSAWVNLGQVIDGALVVTGSLTAAAIDTRGLTSRAPDGTLILGAGGLQSGFEAPGTKNSDIIIGGRNLVLDSGFERGTRTFAEKSATVTIAIATNVVGVVEGTKALLIESAAATSAKDSYVYVDGVTAVVAGRNYVISYSYASATVGAVTGNSSAMRLSNGSHILLPMSLLHTSGAFRREVLLWTCPSGITSVQFRFGVICDGYTWVGVDCLQMEEGNTVTQWRPAPEDAQSAADGAQTAADAANAGLASKLNKNADDILGGVLAVNTVSVPVGLRVGSLTWNAAGARTSGSGLGFTPQGAIAYNSIGTLTFFVNATNGDAYFAGQLAAAYGSFGAVTIAAGGSISSGQTAFNTGNGYHLSFASGVAKFSVGNSAGAYMYYDGSVLRISGVTYDAFTLDVPDFYQSGGAGVRYFSMTATKTGGKGTVKYQWSFVSEASEPGISIQSGANSATCNFACINKTAGTSASGTAICTVIDEDGRSANDSALVEQQY